MFKRITEKTLPNMNMLRPILMLLLSPGFVFGGDASWIESGFDFFPIVVALREIGTGKPMAGATVNMENDKEPLPSTKTQPASAIRDSYYEPRRTDAVGMATLFYSARYYRYFTGGGYRYIRGKLRISAKGFKPVDIDLAKWSANYRYRAEESSVLVLHIQVNLAKSGEDDSDQAGADQPATKPAEKVPSKNQPSTPTSRGAPR